jgi:hypothetical protein
LAGARKKKGRSLKIAFSIRPTDTQRPTANFPRGNTDPESVVMIPSRTYATRTWLAHDADDSATIGALRSPLRARNFRYDVYLLRAQLGIGTTEKKFVAGRKKRQNDNARFLSDLPPT